MKTIFRPVVIAMLIVVIAGAALLTLPASTAAAQSPTPSAPLSPTPQAQADKAAQHIARLEKAYQVENNTLDRQSKWLGNTDNVVTRIQGVIARLGARGIDTSRLQAALANFQTKVVDANAFHTTAAGILSTHAGFDANGKVTAPAQALDTIKAAHQALSDVRSTIAGTIKNLQQIVKELRGSLKPTQQNP